MPGKRPPPRGAPKGKPQAGPNPKAGPKPKPSGIPQAAIDASNAARRAGLGGVARKGASEVMSPRKGDAPARNAPQKWTADDWTDEGDVRDQARGAVAARQHQAATADRQPRCRQQRAGREPAARRRQRLRRCRRSKGWAEAPAALRERAARRTSATASGRPDGSSSRWCATRLRHPVCGSCTA